MKYDEMSNSELKIKMLEMENEYESIKNKISLYIDKMAELDKEYIKIQEIFNKRTKGMII